VHLFYLWKIWGRGKKPGPVLVRELLFNNGSKKLKITRAEGSLGAKENHEKKS